MSVKGYRRILFGDKELDKNAPENKERYEREVKAGRDFAKMTRLDKGAAKIQGFANAHRILFLVLVFGFVLSCFCLNVYRMVNIYSHKSPNRTAVEIQDSLIRQNYENNNKNR